MKSMNESQHRRLRAVALAAALACAAHPLCAQQQREQASPSSSPKEDGSPATTVAAAALKLAPVTVLGNYDNAVGTSDAASQGTVTSKLIENRPTLRPAEVLEFVPGVIVTQHSGDGKANQYYLRGFNLDHGTDFATLVEGMPVNMPTHAHGHGYSDLNWLIPELVDRISYKKGPYYADEGDFSSAGAARISLFGGLPKGLASLTLGEHQYERALIAKSMALGDASCCMPSRRRTTTGRGTIRKSSIA
jgi:outer membrane cobalamin receptor